MYTPERTRDVVPPPSRTPPPKPPSARRRLLDHLPSALVVCLVGGLILGFFVGLYHRYPLPVGWDTARYIDQTNLASLHGIAGVAQVALPRPSKILASRVGFPVTVLTMAKVFDTNLFKPAATVPIAALVAAALSAGTFITYSLRRGAWELAAVAAVVGTSAAMVRLIAGTYTDNLLAAALFTTMLVPLLSVARDGRGFIAASLLLAVGGLVHPAFFAVMVVVLGVMILLYAPASWRAWRRKETGLLSTPSVRMGAVAGGASSLAAVTIYGILGAVPDTPLLNRVVFAAKLKEDLPLYWLPVTVPIAAAGAGTLVAQERRAAPSVAGDGGSPSGEPRPNSPHGPDRFTARFVIALLGAWVAVAVAGIAAFYAGRRLPAHRFLAFLLPLPILLALALLGAARWVDRRGARRFSRRRARVAAVAVALIGVIGLGLTGFHSLYDTLSHRGLEFVDYAKVHDTVDAGAYLDAMHIPVSQPLVFLITDTGPQPQLYIPEETHILRSALPPERIEHSWFYIGTAENYLSNVPTQYTGDTRLFNPISLRFWRVLQRVLPQHPIALLIQAFNPDFDQVVKAHPDWVVATNVIALNGPRPAAPVPNPPVPTAARGLIRGGLYGIGTLAVFVALGMGWALALLPGGVRPFEILALSAGFGIAFLVLAGTLVDFAGVSLGGIGGALTPVGVALAGWAAGLLRLRRRGLELFAA